MNKNIALVYNYKLSQSLLKSEMFLFITFADSAIFLTLHYFQDILVEQNKTDLYENSAFHTLHFTLPLQKIKIIVEQEFI